MLEKLSKKLVTTLSGMASLLYIATLVFCEVIDHTHKIELYGLIISSVAALAGLHGLFKSKLDKFKISEKNS